MSILLLFVCLMVLPLILGGGVLKILYFKQAQKFHVADKMIVGWLTVIGLGEAAHLAAVFLEWKFSWAVIFFAVGVAALTLVTGAICLWRKTCVKGKEPEFQWTVSRFGMILAFLLLVIWQIMTIMSGDAVYRTGDMTVETVKSFLETDAVYKVNPLTGGIYERGIPLRIRILGLPTLYGALCILFDVSAVDLVWKYIPLVVLLLSYMAFGLIGKVLFDGERKPDKDGNKRLMFMVFVALIFCVGDYLYGMDGYGLLHCGFQGVVIRNVVLIPYMFSLGLRHKWRPVMLVLLAEASIAWTLYGMGMSLLVLLGMALIRLIQKGKASALQDVGEGA